ncbi:uncharacterized protein LOC142522344 [Primulina tabacum]|uniref:uncharacterized protein LOC142522344 n=1 Tax=Primulina tabacum TaxID=48773 RepID=UPI003F598307
MALIIPSHLKFKPPNFLRQQKFSHFDSRDEVFSAKNSTNTLLTSRNHCLPHKFAKPFGVRRFSVLTRACSDGDGVEIFAAKEQPFASDVDTSKDSSSSWNDGYIAMFVRMLGLDNDPQDREQAVVTLWKYSLGGKEYVDNIMRFSGIVNLIVNLLKLDSDSACEAAAGLLRVISAINVYRDLVAESAAVEEMTGLLRRCPLSSEVKEQSICTLWNLSVDGKVRARITSSEILPLLVKFLEDEDLKVIEAAGGVLANLALSHSEHEIMIEAGVIPKLAKFLKFELEESKVIRKVARNALLEFAKDEYNRILVMEEGIVLVPLIGTAAYKSFRPALYSWPYLPDGTEIEQTSKGPSKYGASELLLGLNVQEKNIDLDEAKINALAGRTQQQFLARIGAIEMEFDNKSDNHCNSNERFTLLPWIDGVARLVLILGLEDESAIARAARSIADASFNEHMRISFMEAGALKFLIQLINHSSDTIRLAVLQALDKMSISNDVCQKIEAEGVLHPLINLLKHSKLETSQSLIATILSILTRILDPNKGITLKVFNGTVNNSKDGWDETGNPKSDEGNDTVSSKSSPSGQTVDLNELVDSTVFTSLVDIMKTSNPDLQRKASSIIEFITMIKPCVEKLVLADIESGLEAVFRQKSLTETEDDAQGKQPELRSLELEEAGQAVSAASRLLTRLLDHDHFRQTVNYPHLTELLRTILVSDTPLHYKDRVAASLVKLSSLSGRYSGFENPISTEVTLYETIPRLILQIQSSSFPEVQQAAVLELNRIISEGLMDSSRAVASEGGIFALVKLMEIGNDRAKEASLEILCSLGMDSENHAVIVAAGAVPILKKIVLSQGPQWTRALSLLRTLPT